MLLNFPLSFDSFLISESKFADFSARLVKENASNCYQIESHSIDLVSKPIATLIGSHGFLICTNSIREILATRMIRDSKSDIVGVSFTSQVNLTPPPSIIRSLIQRPSYVGSDPIKDWITVISKEMN